MIRRIALGILVLVGLSSGSAWAQRYPERRVLRSGNSLYEKKQYPEAETKYRKAQDMNPTYEGLFNLADVLYKQKRYEEALNILKQIARDDVAGLHAPDAYYNLGNTYFQMKKLPEAAEAYKNTLRRNPSDDEARYNLAYVLELMKQNNNNQNNNNWVRAVSALLLNIYRWIMPMTYFLQIFWRLISFFGKARETLMRLWLSR